MYHRQNGKAEEIAKATSKDKTNFNRTLLPDICYSDLTSFVNIGRIETEALRNTSTPKNKCCH